MMTDRDTMSHCASSADVIELYPVAQPKVESRELVREKIIDLLRQNKTSNQVAQILGVTRNSVMGIKHRYNLRNPGNKIGRIKDDLMWRGKPKPKLPEIFDANGYIPDGAKKIWQLKDDECKYGVSPHGVPPDSHLFCGAKVSGNSPYCVEHHRICRETVNERKGRKGKDSDNPARGAVRLPSRLNFHY